MGFQVCWWPRSYLAQMVGALNQGGAKAVGLPIFLSEPQLDPGLKSIRDINEFYNQQLATLADNPAIGELGMKLAEAESTLNTDQQLADSMSAVVKIKFGPTGTKSEKIELKKIMGNWYLSDF